MHTNAINRLGQKSNVKAQSSYNVSRLVLVQSNFTGNAILNFASWEKPTTSFKILEAFQTFSIQVWYLQQ